MEHELVSSYEPVADSSIQFGGRTTKFKCMYPRAVSVSDDFIVPVDALHITGDASSYVGNGTLHFDVTHNSEVANGRTSITIAPTHGITSLEAK